MLIIHVVLPLCSVHGWGGGAADLMLLIAHVEYSAGDDDDYGDNFSEDDDDDDDDDDGDDDDADADAHEHDADAADYADVGGCDDMMIMLLLLLVHAQQG